jgi:hypothetical protein
MKKGRKERLHEGRKAYMKEGGKYYMKEGRIALLTPLPFIHTAPSHLPIPFIPSFLPIKEDQGRKTKKGRKRGRPRREGRKEGRPRKEGRKEGRKRPPGIEGLTRALSFLPTFLP